MLTRGLKNGLALSLTTALALLYASSQENNGPWGAFNYVCHMVDGDDAIYSDGFQPRESLLGLALNASAMAAWGVIYDFLFGGADLPGSLFTAALVTVGAYFIDYHLVPKRFTPGIENKISKNAIYRVYGVLALTLALSPLWNEAKEKHK